MSAAKARRDEGPLRRRTTIRPCTPAAPRPTRSSSTRRCERRPGWSRCCWRGSAPTSRASESRIPGTPFSSVNGDPNQYFVFTETEHFDFFTLTSRDKSLYSQHLTNFLLAHRPDVVHLQHTHFIGLDLLSQIRRVLPDAAIVYTLHEFLPICHRDGQMVRTFSSELCAEASPRRCHECFPEISEQSFFLRERFVKGQFENVDRFIAPSAQLMEKYLEWGIEPDRIEVEEYGRLAPPVRAPEPEQSKAPGNIGFFGQLSHFKGAKVMLEAMSLLERGRRRPPLAARREPRAADRGVPGRVRGDARRRSAAASPSAAPTTHSELPKLMADLHWVVVPSIWWENSPLVIQEAFFHRRPVICSDVGGMAEKVSDGVDGIHFRVGDAFSLAGRSRPRRRARSCGARCATESASPTRWTPTSRACWTLYGELVERAEGRWRSMPETKAKA